MVAIAREVALPDETRRVNWPRLTIIVVFFTQFNCPSSAPRHPVWSTVDDRHWQIRYEPPYLASPIIQRWCTLGVWPRNVGLGDSKVMRAGRLAGCYATLVGPLMNTSGSETDDEAMADPVELEIASDSRTHRRPLARAGEPQGMLARGTRERPLTPEPEELAEELAEDRPATPVNARPRRTREIKCARDPAEVLRMWPHSNGASDEHPAAAAGFLPPAPSAPAGRPRAEDKIILAHLALDLYREIDDLQAEARGKDAAASGSAAPCGAQGCEAQINTLRGALIEACLLVQRMAMMTPAVKQEVDGRVRELLKLVGP
jgi:hypothetical protein